MTRQASGVTAAILCAALLLACPVFELTPNPETGGADSATDSATDSTAEPGLDAPETGGDEGLGDGESTDTVLSDLDATPDIIADIELADDGSSAGWGDTDADLTVCLSEGAPCQPQFNLICHEGRCDADLFCAHIPIEGCCYKDSDCDLSQTAGCLEMRCVTNECALLPIPGCCDAGTTCAPSGCGQSSCQQGRCQSCPADDGSCVCPSNPITSQAGFGGTTELSESGFFVTDYNQEDAVTWSVDTTRWARPPAALYLGDPLCRTYYNGALSADCQPLTDGSDASPVKMVLYTPTINLTDGFNTSGAGKVALFALWADVEDVAGPADRLTITVDEIGAQFVSWSVATSDFVGKDTDGQWRVIAVDLAPFEGKVVRLRLEFDTIDNQDNAHEGLYLDDWQVVDRCAGGGCCNTDADCGVVGPADPCVTARCVAMADGGGSVCATVAANPGEACQACSVDADCEDDNPCTSDTCGPDGTCNSQVFCCFEQFVVDAGFDEVAPPKPPAEPAFPDEALPGWMVEDGQPDDAVTWRLDATDGVSNGTSLWCGNPATGTYEGPGPVAVSVSTPPIDVPPILPGPGAITAQFWVKLATEWLGSDYVNPLGVDRLSVSVVTPNGALELWSSDLLLGTTAGAWIPVTIDLKTWAGQSIALKFAFDTVDDAANAFGGPRIDDLRVGRTCL